MINLLFLAYYAYFSQKRNYRLKFKEKRIKVYRKNIKNKKGLLTVHNIILEFYIFF